MQRSRTGAGIPGVRPLSGWGTACFLLLTGVLPVVASARESGPLERVRSLGLDSADEGRVTVYFDPADRAHARELAVLTEKAAEYFAGEFGVSFPLRLAVLGPDRWFMPYGGGDDEPYGMPWGWVEDLLMCAPASLENGVLILGPEPNDDRRRVRFVLLHEYGHLANKRILHPDDALPYSGVRWFEEFLATYFAYAFVREHDAEWAASGRREWTYVVGGEAPGVLSLDWGFMRELPPQEFGPTYAWYQNLLNLRAAEVYEVHGLGFLARVRDAMDWENAGEWTVGSVLESLETIAPGFLAWAEDLERGEVLPADGD